MADELQITLGLTYTNGNLKDTVATGVEKITQTTQMIHGSCVSVGTSEEDLSVGDITAANGCWVWMKNIDSTNFVKFGPKSGGSMVEFGRLYSGKSAWFFLAPAAVLRWVADTAAVKVHVKLFEK